MRKRFWVMVFCTLLVARASSQQKAVWHDTIRKVHYLPEGQGFVLNHGERKFNRALYGTNTGFRVEAGDLPEFAMYMPGMGGNFKLGLISETGSKWLAEADHISTKYFPGIMEYEITDPFLEYGRLRLKLVALADAEGFILKLNAEGLPEDMKIIWIFGGVSGKKFHRDGDIGADPESVFYLQPEYCQHNEYEIRNNSFSLQYKWDENKEANTQYLSGTFPSSEVALKSAKHQESPLLLWNSAKDSLPAIAGQVSFRSDQTVYWEFRNGKKELSLRQKEIAKDFEKAVHTARQISERVQLRTPDPFLNNLGGALAIAADAIWESPAYLHGAVAWRMHLNAWRGAYAADLLGWHERAKSHFESYANAQVLSPAEGPVVPDTSRFFARQQEKIGTAMFSRGYISRHPNDNSVAHHYDMNLVFIDQLLTHFQWTGDMQFLKNMWPVVKRHLAWEKRNFDADGDGLYDAYAAIWASDALQYSGGGVTYTSAYNYRANEIAAKLARIMGEDPKPYLQEAQHIYQALQEKLWLPEKGVYAEYKDLLGNKLLHKEPGIWTVYHSIDKKVVGKFQAFQELNYVDNQIPHIPVTADGLDEDLYLLSTTNWQPYTWSVNNVALAENLNTALAFWQGGDIQSAFKLWKSAMVESMYLSASPGNFEQLSFYDAARGELYRDFADPVGVAARALVEGLFGIHPDALKDTLTIEPGFPAEWQNASLKLSDIAISMEKGANRRLYHIEPNFPEPMNLRLKLKLSTSGVEDVFINEKKTSYHLTDEIGSPEIIVEAKPMPSYEVKIELNGEALEKLQYEEKNIAGGDLLLNLSKAEILSVKDPQKALRSFNKKEKSLAAKLTDETGDKIFFIKLRQGSMGWWEPVEIAIRPEVEIVSVEDEKDSVVLRLQNNSKKDLQGKLSFGEQQPIKNNLMIPTGTVKRMKIGKSNLMTGTNKIDFQPLKGDLQHLQFQSWDIPAQGGEKWDMIDLSDIFNSKVTDIFKNQYFSPRPDSPTLQLPTTGIGNWCYPEVCEDISIDDSGLRRAAGKEEKITLPQGIPFQTPSGENKKNILFASQWDVYPQQIKIPLQGKASHAYFLMAGTTNPMQSRLVNGKMIVTYDDGTKEELLLKNPENWWPVEQDYYADGFAFTTGAPVPLRVHFKTGKSTKNFKEYVSIHGFSDQGIEGGAGTVLDLPLDPSKNLKSLTLSSVANDVVIGLMSLTLKR